MTLSYEILITLALAIIGGVVWLVRLEGRVNRHEDILTRNDNDHKDIKEDLKYLIKRLDNYLSNNGCGYNECPAKNNNNKS